MSPAGVGMQGCCGLAAHKVACEIRWRMFYKQREPRHPGFDGGACPCSAKPKVVTSKVGLLRK